ncbi:hypothetical protein [Thermanaerovibrio velox]|uniref:hypothetical protein n=1 Tax=Thermanaerovibrio velox TaxID=108007 RepID=UPI0002F85079|nr:hypothetical protein [Thermanaerovibrio velox]
MRFEGLELERYREPQEGSRIVFRDGKMEVPDDPVIPYVEGDGDRGGHNPGDEEGFGPGGS